MDSLALRLKMLLTFAKDVVPIIDITCIYTLHDGGLLDFFKIEFDFVTVIMRFARVLIVDNCRYKYKVATRTKHHCTDGVARDRWYDDVRSRVEDYDDFCEKCRANYGHYLDVDASRWWNT